MFVKWQSLDFGSGSGSKFNCAGRVGSDDFGYGPGSGFSFEPVQTSNIYAYLSNSVKQGYTIIYLSLPLQRTTTRELVFDWAAFSKLCSQR